MRAIMQEFGKTHVLQLRADSLWFCSQGVTPAAPWSGQCQIGKLLEEDVLESWCEMAWWCIFEAGDQCLKAIVGGWQAEWGPKGGPWQEIKQTRKGDREGKHLGIAFLVITCLPFKRVKMKTFNFMWVHGLVHLLFFLSRSFCLGHKLLLESHILYEQTLVSFQTPM